MHNEKFTEIGAVRAVIADYYGKNRKKQSFVEALKLLEERGKLHEEKTMPVWPGSMGCLRDNEFEEYLMHLPVRVYRILENDEKTAVYENIVIPYGRDIFSFLHLPYVNDGKHEHNYFEINYVYRGKCIQQITGESRQMLEGEFCIIAPHTSHNVQTEGDSLVISIMVRKTTFDAIFGSLLAQNDLLSAFFKNTLYETTQSNYILFHAENTEEIKNMVQTIVKESNYSEKYANLYCNSALQILFCTLLRRYSDTILYYGYEKNDSNDVDFSLILEYVQQHYQTVTLKTLAEFFHYSESYLSALFKKNLNQNFIKVLQNLKMHKAVEYLANTDLSIEQITEQVGYDSVDYFSRNFKKHFQCSPSVYRKKIREDR